MWNCKKCDEKIEDSFDTCWNCGYDKTGEKIMSESFDETKKESKEYFKLTYKYSSLKTYKGMCEIFKILMILGTILGVVQSIKYESSSVFIISIFSFIITMTILSALTLSIKFLFDLDTKIQNDK